MLKSKIAIQAVYFSILRMSQRNFLNIQDTKQYYLDNILRYGIDAPRTMGYHSAPIDDRLISNLLPKQLPDVYSVLDVGCGLGQLIPILEQRFPESQLLKFHGLDLVEEFIQRCREQYPHHQFTSVDFLEWQMTQKFDLVLAAGVLVTRISDFEQYLEKFVSRMVAASKGFVGFNVVASCGPNYTAKHLATISEEKMQEVLNSLPDVSWQMQKKEVFPGALDTFICGLIKTTE